MRPGKRRQFRNVQQQCFATQCFLTAMDSIIGDLDSRFHAASKILKEFSAVSKVGQISEDEAASICEALIIKYGIDLTSEFDNEV